MVLHGTEGRVITRMDPRLSQHTKNDIPRAPAQHLVGILRAPGLHALLSLSTDEIPRTKAPGSLGRSLFHFKLIISIVTQSYACLTS